MPRIVFHLPPHLLQRVPRAAKGFYGELHHALHEAGGHVEFRERAFLRAHVAFEDDAFHFVHQGLVDMPNVLNTGPSYLRDFWYADPKGVFGESSMRSKMFDPSSVRKERAAKYFSWLRERILNKRLSKHRQPDEKVAFDGGHVAVFLQGESLPVLRAGFVSEVEMVAGVIDATPDRPILIKRHPRNEAQESWSDIQAMAADHERVMLVDANVHDILEGAALSCSISSSVSVEGMLHRVPALVFGRTDFHHCAVTVETPLETGRAVASALQTDWPFEAFLFWFFRQNGLDLRSKVWRRTLSERMGQFSPSGFG
ncbi:hypothetical protein [Shimia abyssi]|uniref:Capsular polysaccharide biosynthesis protein n=1 Tax=Shimia abyssi TaxID=1662395 RepID=A0A2P8F5X0_9RHOB|nr:hypothetical protein [Shimia abyssi]PSL17107.1 capsular polysaccharide biosynthesis protein [Shimia abyssi]